MSLSNKKSKGPQHKARTDEQRRKNLESVKRYYSRKRDGVELEREDGPQLMGLVPKLIPGAINPVHTLEVSLTNLSKLYGPYIAKRHAPRTKKITTAGKGGFIVTEVPIEEEESDDIINK